MMATSQFRSVRRGPPAPYADMDESAPQEVLLAWPAGQRSRLLQAERPGVHLRKGQSGLAQLVELGQIRAGLDDVDLGVCTDIGQAEPVNLAEQRPALGQGQAREGSLLAEADGNPLALLELPAGLTAAQLEGLAPLPEAMPLTPRLESVFRQRTAQLPGAAQTALLIAAADNTGEVPAVLRAAAELKLPADALDPAQRAGLIQVTGATIVFRHPLVRSAVYQAATLGQRQRAHAALADALSGAENTDRRVWHQAMATLTGDEEVAAALEASARRARLRAGHASAATAFLRAAELSTDDARRVQRIAAAAQAAWDAGQPGRARDITGRALPLADDQTRAHLLHLAGVIEARTGSLPEACAMLLAAADACTDLSLTLDMLAEAAEGASFSGDMTAVTEIGQRSARLSAADELDAFKLTSLRAFARLYAGDYEDAQVLLADALDRAAALTDPRALLWAADAASIRDGLGAGYGRCEDNGLQQKHPRIAPNGGSRVSHDRRAFTVSNKASEPGLARSGARRVSAACFRFACGDAQRRGDDIIGKFPSGVGDHARLRLVTRRFLTGSKLRSRHRSRSPRTPANSHRPCGRE
jgi:hypothetical protein